MSSVCESDTKKRVVLIRREDWESAGKTTPTKAHTHTNAGVPRRATVSDAAEEGRMVPRCRHLRKLQLHAQALCDSEPDEPSAKDKEDAPSTKDKDEEEEGDEPDSPRYTPGEGYESSEAEESDGSSDTEDARMEHLRIGTPSPAPNQRNKTNPAKQTYQRTRSKGIRSWRSGNGGGGSWWWR